MTTALTQNLQGKVIFVTGGARGIGEAAARLCAARGGSVILADVIQESGEAVAASIRDEGGKARFEQLDVRVADQVAAVMQRIQAQEGRLDVVICAAGVLLGPYLQPEEFPEEDFEKVLDINVKGPFLCAKYAAPLLEASGSGVMVIVASGAGIKGPSSSLAYGASKAGANGLGMTLENHLRGRGIRVNVVAPGGIATVMKESVIEEEARRSGRSPQEAVAQARATQLGTPDGVAKVLAFLASDEADYVRGILYTR